MSPEAIELARRNVEQARGKVNSTLGALQYRLKPATLADHAWEGVREKSSEVADTAFQAVKGRPVAVSGVVAAAILYLARNPIRRAVSGMFSNRGEEAEGVILADLEREDRNIDLAAPDAPRATQQGASA
jgi:hypothetical protein